MLKKKNIKFEEIKGILSYPTNIEKLLSIINNNFDIIAEYCQKENQAIIISELVCPNINDDLIKIKLCYMNFT